MAAVFDDDIHNLMDVHVEEQPRVIIREEFLHDPSILPSHHLNVTVIVQNKGKTGPASELRAVGKAVLDTANYSENFVSFTMLEKLNATHLCYPALKAITVCSGLDGQCYLNNEIRDLKILFYSYDGECQSISLPMRMNRKTGSSKKRGKYGLQEYPYKKSILHGQSSSKSNVSCVHSMSTCNDTQMDIEGVATENSCGDVSCH